ncbi:E3 ubiquitin-protein ligase lubel [Palaemon carinicauda]|uniref:E3 ubiquitin-protein ligase lubel n=1 Tax=Palaemon carinicauda TaxID=392227 RepID=UPI0035B5958B
MVGKEGIIKPPRTKSYSKEKLYSILKLKKRPPPPPKAGGDRRNNEPEYEEVGPPTSLRRNQEKRGDGHHCDLCGSMEAAVRCDRCGSQAFCLSCDDMYHRHPRRSSHFRKAVDSLNSSGGGVRPPLPPKGEGQGAPPPQPPPRKNKRAGFLSNTGFSKKEQNYQYSTGSGHGSYRSASLTNLQNGPNNADGGSRYSLALPIRKPTSASSEAGGSAGRTIMGSLKRFMGARPLPPTPDQAKSALKNERQSSVAPKILTRANTSPSLPNLSEPLSNEDIRAGLPQSVLDINRTRLPNNSTSTPVTPASAHAQYPPLQPKTQPSNAHTQSLGRKFSLQQLPQSFDDKRTSMVEGTPGSLPWDAEAPKPATRNRSQSVSDDQWAQMMAAQVSGGNTELSGPTCPPGHTPADMSAFAGATTRRSFNTMGGGTRSVSSLGRGMVSSASVCDLNTLAQQQTQHGFNNSHGANSFQQLNMMGYNNGMMWGAPCDLCQGPGMYPGHPTAGGMKRTASNLSMNLSSVGSDVSGYPWGPPPPHMHHHVPPMYLGYYPGYHPHMGPPPMGSGMGLNMSIPDSMHTFGKVPSSPAPSLRSSSHRSHKSSKSRSFSAADTSGRSSRARKLKRSEESAESRSSSVTDDDEIEERESKSGHHSSSIAWQCDHCTFINSGGARTCGMCSKTVGTSGRNSSRRGSERRRSERRRDRRTDHEDDERDVSDYDNDGGVVKSNLSFNIKDSKRDTRTKVSGSSKSKSKKKSRRRSSSASDSESGSEGEDERLERHMKDLRLSSSSSRRRGSDYEGINHKDKDRDRERNSRKKEGSSGRFKNWGRSHSERSRTPGRQTPRPASPVDDIESGELSPESSPPDNGQGQIPNNNKNELNGSPNETVVDGDASEGTMKNDGKSRSGSRDRRYEIKKERAPTPPPSPVEENVQETNPEKALIPEVMNGNKSRSCSPRLQVPKGRSPARSARNSKGDVDEPSFANTLDDITTIGTNEVADQDFSQYIDEHLQSSSEHPQLEEPHEDVPVFNYIRPETPEEEVIEEAKTVADVPNPVATVNKNIDAQEKEIVSKDTGQTEQKPEVIPYSVYEPRYEPIEEPAQPEASPSGDSGQAGIQIQVQSQSAKEEAEDNNEIGTLERFLKAHEGKQGSPMVLRNIDVARASSGSSLGHSSPPERDRQYTPLSCSSSDAQFYSPPDSPDLSLSEQLKDVPATSQTQAFTLNQDGRPTNISQTFRSGEDESYLVTALESMQTTTKAAEDLKSSRETIRSSMEQLPYSEEAFDGESAKEPPPRPASAGAAPPIDSYESLSFEDALTSSVAANLARSSSAKDLLLSSAVVYDNTTKEMSYGILSLRQEADRQARAAAWSKEDLSEKYMTVEEIITKRRQKVMETQGLQLVQVLRDAEDAGYTSEEVSIALTHCGDKSPLEWLKENWKHMVDTVLTLATNYGHERRVNDIGSISASEARIALRVHKGNIWAAVTECVEQRQKKFNDIYSRGKFKRADIVKALETHSGDVDAAFLEVNKSQVKPFLMKIWGSMSPSPSLAKGTQSPAPAVSSSASNEVSTSPAPSRSTTKEMVTSQTTQTDKDITAWVEDNDDDDDDDDDEDVFENVYANIKPLREEPHPPPDQLYANVNIASKKMKLVKESVKSKKLAKKAIQKQEQDEDELFTASETAGIESDEESTIEELLADVVSPNYYEYFTAVDLDDEEVYVDEDEDDTEEEEERYYDEDGEVEEFEESDDDNDETETEGVENDLEEEDEDIYEYRDAVFSDAEGDSDPLEAFSDPQSGEEEEEAHDDAQNDDQFEELQFVRKEDVVVHPLKAFTHYADLSVSEYSEGRVTPANSGEEATPYKPSSFISSNYDTSSADSRANATPKPPREMQDGKSTLGTKAAAKKARKYSSTLHVSLSTQKQTSEHTTEKVQSSFVHQKPFQDLRTPDGYESIATPFEEKERVAAQNVPAGSQAESKSAPSSARNSLLLEDYEVSDEEEESVSITTGRLSLSLSAASINVKSEVIQTAQVPAAEHEEMNAVNQEQTGDVDQDDTADENVKNQAESNLEADADPSTKGKSEDIEDDQGKESPYLDEPGMAQTRPGPVTVQKASVIVGKAIAKAMARETSARESQSRSVTPEGQENTLTTPEPSEGEEDTTGQVTVSDSDDEDHLRTLDTIPEEEEISERTESKVSRSASRNLFLPFNPTDVIQLSPVAKALSKLTGAKTVGTKAKSKDLSSGSIDSTPGTPHSYYNAAQQNVYYNESGGKNATQENSYYNESGGKNATQENSYYNESGGKNATQENSYYNESGGKNATQENSYYNESGGKNATQENSYYNESGGKNATQENSYYNESGGKNATQQNAYYNESGGKNYYNEATGKNYYNESGAKMEGVVSGKQPPDDYESMAEVKEKSDASTLELEVSVDAPVASPPTQDMKEDDAEEEEVIYYEEVILKTDEKPSDENTSENTSTRRRRRRRRKSRGHGSGTAETYSRADVVESPVGDDSAPAAIASTPSPTPAAVPEPSKERSPSADYSTVKKTTGRTSALSDSKPYSIIEMVKATEGTSKPTDSSGESEEEGEGPEKAEMVSQDDRLKVPNLLVQIEGLKARHNKEPDYQEVRELKEQIQMMRKQLEARMEEDTETRPDTPETPQDEQPPQGPLLLLQGSPTVEGPPREYEQLKFDRTVRRLLAEGQAGSYEKAELAAQLMNFNFDEYDSIQAAEECSSIYTAIQFLQQECELCAEKYPMGKMVSMLQCTHRCCRECAKTYFTFQIKTKNIRDLRCPFCNEPDLDACEEIANEYLNNMDILLKNIIDAETHELFQRKLRDWTLMKDPNFRWCNKCSSGFIANPRARKLICPDCKDVTCAQCRATWESSHEGISCEAFAQWKIDNDLEVQAQGVARHLAENGITCPKCKFTYSLAKGGCMHFTCTQCKYEFCSGCGEPFRQGAKCPVGPYCERMGLHAHHPRNCLFYLRDKEPHQLQNLLKDAGISYDTESTQVRDPNKTKILCLVQEQKELPDGLKDDICGRIVPNGYAGLCKTHYLEYLGRLVYKFNLDPLPLMGEEDLRYVLRRENLQAPKRIPGEKPQDFLERLNELIKEHLPLDTSEQ